MRASKLDVVSSAVNYIKKKYPGLQDCDIEDLTQDAWLWISSPRQNKNIHSAVRAYLSKKVLFYMNQDLSLEGNNLGYAIDSFDPMLILEWKESAHALGDCISEIGSRRKEAIMLKYGLATDFEEPLSLEQISRIFCATRSSIEQLISKSIRELKGKYSYTLNKSCRLLLEGYDFYYRIKEYRDAEDLIKEIIGEEAQAREKMRQEALRREEEYRLRREKEQKEEEERRKQEQAEKEELEARLKQLKQAFPSKTLEEIQLATKLVIEPYDCPQNVIEFFIQDRSMLLGQKSGEGFYLVVVLPSEQKYIIGNYGHQDKTQLGYPGISIKAWSLDAAPAYLQNIVSRPRSVRTLYCQESA